MSVSGKGPIDPSVTQNYAGINFGAKTEQQQIMFVVDGGQIKVVDQQTAKAGKVGSESLQDVASSMKKFLEGEKSNKFSNLSLLDAEAEKNLLANVKVLSDKIDERNRKIDGSTFLTFINDYIYTLKAEKIDIGNLGIDHSAIETARQEKINEIKTDRAFIEKCYQLNHEVDDLSKAYLKDNEKYRMDTGYRNDLIKFADQLYTLGDKDAAGELYSKLIMTARTDSEADLLTNSNLISAFAKCKDQPSVRKIINEEEGADRKKLLAGLQNLKKQMVEHTNQQRYVQPSNFAVLGDLKKSFQSLENPFESQGSVHLDSVGSAARQEFESFEQIEKRYQERNARLDQKIDQFAQHLVEDFDDIR